MSKTIIPETVKTVKQKRFQLNFVKDKHLIGVYFNLPVKDIWQNVSPVHKRRKLACRMFRLHFSVTLLYITLRLNWLYLKINYKNKKNA